MHQPCALMLAVLHQFAQRLAGENLNVDINVRIGEIPSDSIFTKQFWPINIHWEMMISIFLQQWKDVELVTMPKTITRAKNCVSAHYSVATAVTESATFRSLVVLVSIIVKQSVITPIAQKFVANRWGVCMCWSQLNNIFCLQCSPPIYH